MVDLLTTQTRRGFVLGAVTAGLPAALLAACGAPGTGGEAGGAPAAAKKPVKIA